MSYSKCLLLSISAVAVSVAAVIYWRRRQSKEFHAVGQVTGLYVYPVKSCKGIPLDSVVCLEQGLQHDRYKGHLVDYPDPLLAHPYIS